MTADNLDAVRRFIEAFNRLDLDSIEADLDPDVELHEWPEAPGARSYRGPGGVREALGNWFDVWEWMRVEVEQLVDAGDLVLVTLHQRAKGKGSEAEVEIRSFNVYAFRDSKVVAIELFTEEKAALRAAGLDAGRVGDDLERQRQVTTAVARADVGGLATLLDPDVVWEHNIGVGSPEEGVYRGRESVVALFERILEPWEQLLPVQRTIRVLAEGRYAIEGELQAKHRTSNVEIATPYEQTVELRDGLLVKGTMKTGDGMSSGQSAAA